MLKGYKVKGETVIHSTIPECAAQYKPGDSLVAVYDSGHERPLTGHEIDHAAAAFLAATMRRNRQEQRNAK